MYSILGITQSAVECFTQIEQLRVTSSPIETNVKFISARQTRLTHKRVPYSSHSYSSSRFSVQMDTSQLGLYIAMLVGEEMRRWPYKASDKVWICNGELRSEDLMTSSQSLYIYKRLILTGICVQMIKHSGKTSLGTSFIDFMYK